jgi:hypothetical protein
MGVGITFVGLHKFQIAQKNGLGKSLKIALPERLSEITAVIAETGKTDNSDFGNN